MADVAVQEAAGSNPALNRALPGNGAPVLDVIHLKKHFPVKKGILRRTVGQVYAVDDVTFSIGEGETLGLVGESGCGKSTVARTVLRLIEPTDGSILLDGRDVTRLGKTEMRPYRRQMQIIFQDPFSSLNPRMSAGDIVGEPLQVHDIARGKEKERLTAEIFDQVGLRRSPTWSKISATSRSFSLPCAMSCTCNGSPTISPADMRGFKDENGS